MPLQFTVLASGSAGNASLITVDGFGLLLDAGIGPRTLTTRLRAVGAAWQQVQAILLTHTHSDHWRDTTLAYACRRDIPLYCHPSHHDVLRTYGASFDALVSKELIRSFEANTDLALAPGLRCRPIPLRHDGGATFGFSFETAPDSEGRAVSLAYASDLGSWTADVAEQMAGVELLALEFNHDVELEFNSGRSPYLIARVLGDDGHLSNEQAAGLVHEVVKRAPERLRQLVLLHLSRDCNRPALALQAAHAVVADLTPVVEVHTASQDEPGPTLTVGVPTNGMAPPARPVTRSRKAARAVSEQQPWLPGFMEAV
jgi:phosphoribosyl 1,2-cyclic phosphodiesterase